MATGTTGTVAWVVLVSDDLYSRLAGPQLDAIRNAALADSQDENSVFDAVLPDVAARVRQYIASNPRNRLSQTENSVPPEVKQATIWLVLQEMMARLNIALELRDTQKAAIEQANTDLDRLRNWQKSRDWLLVSQPDDPEGNSAISFSQTTLVSSSCRQMTRDKLRGL